MDVNSAVEAAMPPIAVVFWLGRVFSKHGEKQAYNLDGNMTDNVDQWLQLPEIARMFGLSEESIKRLSKTHGLPLRRITPFATPGALASELVRWLKSQPNVGPPVRTKRAAKLKAAKAKN
jgi:predicted DNA-binding transcriptional regulator AlpA